MDSDDEEPTPQHGRPPVARGLTDSERQRFADRWASGVPAVATGASSGSPLALLDEPPSEVEVEVARRLRRDSSDPLKMAEVIARIAVRLHERERSDSDVAREQIAELHKLLNRPPNGTTAKLVADVDRLTTALDRQATALNAQSEALGRVSWAGSPIFRWVVVAIATLLLGSILTGVGVLWSRAEREGAINSDLQRLKDDVQELLREQRHQSLAPSWAHGSQPAPQGAQP